MDAANASPSQTTSAFDRFSHAVRAWFLDAFEAPTPVQQQTWEAIESGDNALVIAPTGSGKTLAAFLFAIDALMREKETYDPESDSVRSGEERPAPSSSSHQGEVGRPVKGVRVLYVSPLKALGADVERNLQEPLAGIAERLADAGGQPPRVRTGMRTGDTTAQQRRSLTRTPPDILITTPESLYLMLTSKAREGLRTVETVIVDEVHALAGNKRGAHLALSLERLDALLDRPAQRIGLSATVRPREEVARFLGGPYPVHIVASEKRSDMDVRVIVPVRDMTDISRYQDSDTEGTDARATSSSIWPFIEASILDEVLSHRTTIVFVNSRGLCEKLTARLNELYAKRCTTVLSKQDASGPGAVSSHLRSDFGSTTKLSSDVPAIVAKAHHGSMSKEKRLYVEHELKAGRLPCVVATSSLELGIDMGSIDLVLQVAAPPSVASGLQRIGRANHQVGGRSEGAIYPRTRTEIIDAAVVAEGMRKGLIEKTSLIRNPLDVLSQQTVAAVAMGEVAVDAWYEEVRRAAPFSDLPRRAFDSVLDMLAGRHTSADFAEFSPRIVWDRERGVLVPRPGTQRQAVMAAGTIPDRGMFSVVLPEGGGEEGRRRVGELDEEMVYESRVGDIIALGTSSWRIREITRDRVIVEPAPGRSARLPFWHGEGVGRPAETGRARGEFLRAVTGGIDGGQADLTSDVDEIVRTRLDEDGLDVDAQRNLIGLIRAQRQVAGAIPDERTLMVERCEDEAGDWCVILHSPYGRRVHEPWAMAVSDRIMRKAGFDPQAMATDDGIVLRIPMTETRLPGAELFVFDARELDRIVRDRVDSTALFAARFRECAARALLMSPITPGKRAPLWQQRLKAGQLLEAARRERDFPILLETARECLQDVYDMDALHGLMESLQAGVIRIVEAQTTAPSPFAAPLLFGYVGEHLYQGDLPHAERRASLLSLDPTLLGELLGTADMEELLDRIVIRSVEENLQRIAADRRVRGAEGVADLLHVLGPLSTEEVARRMKPADGDGEEMVELTKRAGGGDDSGSDESGARSAAEEAARVALEELYRAHRVFLTMIGGEGRWASADDAGTLRGALGIKVPSWISPAFLDEAAADRTPLDDLVARYARTHGPFSTEEVAGRFGIGPSVARESLERLADEGRIMRGHFGRTDGGKGERVWVSADVFRRLRSLSLAKARKAVRAVDGAAFTRFLFDLQGLGPSGGQRLEGIQGVAQVIAQFEGVFLPASSWEDYVLPSRVRDFRPSMLDELLASGEVLWVGSRRGGDGDEDAAKTPTQDRFAQKRDMVGLVAFYPTDSPLAPVHPDPAREAFAMVSPGPGESISEGFLAPAVEPASDRRLIEAVVVDVMGFGGGLFFGQIVDAVGRRLAPEIVEQAAVAAVLQELVWSGRATNDTFAPVRAAGRVTGNRPHNASRRRASSRRSRLRYVDVDFAGQASSPTRFSTPGTSGAVLSGRWSLLAPSPVNDTVRAIATVESILDRYGVLARDVVMHSGVPGGMAALFPVLRSMEDAGDVLRGTFVEGFGPAQFAARETIDVLRTYAADMGGDGGDDEGTPPEAGVPRRDRVSSSGMVVLAADDPACLFGAGIPWPPIAAGDHVDDRAAMDAVQGTRPTRRPGSLVVVHGGVPVLHVTTSLRSILAFATDDEVLSDAACALVSYVTSATKRAGAEGARRKIVVETFNGLPVLSTPFADVLRACGLVRLPDGMRLYVSPF